MGNFLNRIREIIAIGVWAFAVIKLLVFDVDIYVINFLSPSSVPLLQYRFFALIATLSLLWVALGTASFRRLVVYVACYPLVVLFLYTPIFIFRHWAIAIAFYPAIHTNIAHFRRNFVFTTIAILSLLAIELSDHRVTIIAGMTLLAAFLLFHFIDRVRMAYQPSSVLADLRSIARRFWRYAQEKGLLDSSDKLSKLDPTAPDYEIKRMEVISADFFTTVWIQAAAEKLRDLAVSRLLDIYLICAVLFSVVVTVVVYSALYYGLVKLSSNSFHPVGLSWLDLMGYSFGRLMTADLPDIKPVSGIAQCLVYSEMVFTLLLMVIGLQVVLTMQRERYQQEFDGLLDALGSAHQELAIQFESLYGMSLIDAEVLLMRKHASLINAIRGWRGLERLKSPQESVPQTNLSNSEKPNAMSDEVESPKFSDVRTTQRDEPFID
jgi:Ca2+/Na+ antiporter